MGQKIKNKKKTKQNRMIKKNRSNPRKLCLKKNLRINTQKSQIKKEFTDLEFTFQIYQKVSQKELLFIKDQKKEGKVFTFQEKIVHL